MYIRIKHKWILYYIANYIIAKLAIKGSIKDILAKYTNTYWHDGTEVDYKFLFLTLTQVYAHY